ncbi:MAG: TldD/PmbA family protein [Candidatus Methanomethyliaceae archaeon]|nr:TldD/PmbA family protein [Candidatus Methanomethyliaceae archaeon]
MDGERLLELLMKEGADYAEVRFHRNVEVSGLLKNGEPESPEYVEAYGVGVRVIKGGSLAFASTNMLDWSSIKVTGLRALRMAEACMRHSTRTGISDEATVNKKWGVDFKEDPTKVDASSILEVLKSVDSSIMEVKGVSFPNRLLAFGGSLEEKEYLNSEGTRIRSIVPRVGGYFILTASAGGKGTVQRILQFGESGGWERVSAMRLVEIAKEEGEAMARMLLEGRSVSPGRYDVIVGGEVSGIIAHEGCGHPQEADRIMGREGAQAGESYVKRDMIGRRIGSGAVNISDLPSLPNSYGFYLYDDEGVEVRKKRLIVEGVINEFLHNRETANEFGIKSNGAARATMYSREPIIRMSNTFVEPGDYSLEELLEGVRHGLYIKSFREWNIDDIRWNNRYVGFESYVIENGEICEPVVAPVIEATTEVIFSSIDAVGKDLIFKAATCGKGQPDQGAPVWTGGPSMRMRDLYIKGR